LCVAESSELEQGGRIVTTIKTGVKKATKVRILLVDDHPLLREGLGTRINREPDMTVCGEAGTAVEALEAMARLKPGLTIIDISLPGRDGIELLKDARSRFPKAVLLALSFHDESLYAERALRAGAAGYLMKSTPPDQLIAAIRRVIAGEIALGATVVNRILRNASQSGFHQPQSKISLLSDRELEVFRLLGEGRERNRIATELNLSVKTVDAHRAKICQKLGLRSLTELLQHAVQYAPGELPSARSPKKAASR
jgi:DNA-binding NarL/FixJ family response regulator